MRQRFRPGLIHLPLRQSVDLFRRHRCAILPSEKWLWQSTREGLHTCTCASCEQRRCCRGYFLTMTIAHDEFYLAQPGTRVLGKTCVGLDWKLQHSHASAFPWTLRDHSLSVARAILFWAAARASLPRARVFVFNTSTISCT